jgi:1-acyl-sn-glycerol-3-phosphate acyltransferase
VKHGPSAYHGATVSTPWRIVPDLPPATPARGNAASRALGRAVLWALGWRVASPIPDVPKLVAVVAPHTCGWDVVIGLAVVTALGIRVGFLAKRETFRWPLAWLFKSMGGIPVDRDAPGGLVAQAADAFRTGDRLYLALAPEGTRRKVARWKTGFHRIARAANVPLVPVWLDYRTRQVGIGPLRVATDDLEADMAWLKSHFTADMARHPERY